ncbi:MAG: PIN domain-containing protein [Candidatus Kapabacteria bacterium]|nr:PIN domain-containing protein [Candidatus Kapabacteria bacterium]
MILVDTSIWIEHLRSKEGAIVSLLENELIGIHPFVIGELACGAIKNRGLILELLDDLPMFPVASDNEVRELIESRRLYNRGIGWVDAHLLASVQLQPKSTLLTKDSRLAEIADEFHFVTKLKR